MSCRTYFSFGFSTISLSLSSGLLMVKLQYVYWASFICLFVCLLENISNKAKFLNTKGNFVVVRWLRKCATFGTNLSPLMTPVYGRGGHSPLWSRAKLTDLAVGDPVFPQQQPTLFGAQGRPHRAGRVARVSLRG